MHGTMNVKSYLFCFKFFDFLRLIKLQKVIIFLYVLITLHALVYSYGHLETTRIVLAIH